MEKSFLDLESADTVEARRDLINSAFRHAHSLKSDAKVVGLPELKQAAQALEDILDELRDQPDAVDRDAIDRGLAQFDRVRGVYESWQGGPATAPQPRVSEPTAEPAARKAQTPAEIPPPAKTETPGPKVFPATAEERFTVRVPSERLDRMLNLAGEVRISQRAAGTVAARLGDVCDELSAILATTAKCNQLETALDHVRRVSRDLRNRRGREELLVEALENDIRQARLLPLVMLADSLRRAVRDLAQSLGKSIAYQADVGAVMLDKAVIEALKDPLTHLVRNAADHGIETADERRAAGKREEGTIRIGASRRGQLVRITISDDGRGVDFARVREHVAQRTDLNEAEIAQLSESELTKYLFQAGFSTAPAGDISGRGVGLDVVLDTVRRLQGSVELEDESEVLLKPLGYPLTGLPGAVGATIRADGSVQLVLDPSDRAFAKAGGARARQVVEQEAVGRILVVDDSPTTRAILRNLLTAAGYVVSTAAVGVDALERLAVQAVDVDLAMKAYEAGAVSVIEKPEGAVLLNLEKIAPTLRQELVAASKARLRRSRTPPPGGGEPAVQRGVPAPRPLRVAPVDVIGVCASTGGPPVLLAIFSGLPKPFPIPILLIQHISRGFEDGFARWLSVSTGQPVKMAASGQRIAPGIWIAPGGRHLTVGSATRLELPFGKESEIHCPSGNLLFESLARHFGPKAAGIQLTGMGDDGAQGLLSLRRAGGVTMIQNEPSCLIWGMPKAARQLGAAAHELTPEEIAKALAQMGK